MIIYDNNGNQLLDIPVDDSSCRYRAIGQVKKVELQYSLAGYLELPVGSYINYQEERYTLWSPSALEKKGTRNLSYKATFYGEEEKLKMYKYKQRSDKPYRLKFALTAKPKMFVELLVENLNEYDKSWEVGEVIESVEKPMSFNHENCWSVLGRLAQEFNTEFEIDGKKIHLRKVEHPENGPVKLSYGKGNGFVPGVGRTNQGDKLPVDILYVQGGEKNINFSTYGSKTLLLPKSKELEFDGRVYVTDGYGMCVTREDKKSSSRNEDSYDASHIYPTSGGTVTQVEKVSGTDSAGKPVTYYKITDDKIPDALNYRDCRLDGNKATIIFQSGKLMGREFDIAQTDKELTGYDHATRTFKLVSIQEDGQTLPNDTFCPAEGDEYAVFNISLPPAIVCDDSTYTGASWDMFREAVRYLREREDRQFTFKGELDGIWARRNWSAIGGCLVPGGYVNFSDTQFQPDGLLIRITGVRDYINKPYSPELELSNAPVSGFVSDTLGKLEAEEVVTEEKNKEAIRFTQRRYHDMLEKAIEGFGAAINPITISTMQARIGSEQLQYRYVQDKESLKEVSTPDFKMDNAKKLFTAPAGIIQHMTLGIDSVSASHASTEYSFWDVGVYTSSYLGDDKMAYYLYLKCGEPGTVGSYLLTHEAYPKMDPGDGYYYLLVGTLGSEIDGKRNFETVYGFTEILPGRMTIGLIKSPDGNTYFDLDKGLISGNIQLKAGSSGYKELTDKPDLSQKADVSALRKTGIDIDSKTVTVTADSFKVQDREGTPISVFTTDLAGRPVLKAENIDVDNFYAKHLKAVDGRIGGFNIEGTNLIATSENNMLGLYPSGIDFVREGIRVGVGTNSVAPESGVIIPAFINVTTPDRTANYGMGISVTGADSAFNNIALWLMSGCIGGFRVKTEQVSSNYKIAPIDVFISCYNRQDITLTLPNNPQAGDVKFIRRNYRPGIKIVPTNHQIMRAESLVSEVWIGEDVGDIGILFFDGRYWSYNYMGR